MAWTDFITFRIRTARNNPSQSVEVKIQKQGTPITGSPYTECLATATGNEFSYRSLSNNYNNTQLRSFFKCSFIPRGVFPSFIEQVFSQVPSKDLRVQLNQSLQWQGFYTENSFRIERDTQPDGTITLEFSDGLDKLDNIQYQDILGLEVPETGNRFRTTAGNVLRNIFTLAGYGTNEEFHEYTLIGYRSLASTWMSNIWLYRDQHTNPDGTFFSCGSVLNEILSATNSFIALDNENWDRWYIVSNNYTEFINVTYTGGVIVNGAQAYRFTMDGTVTSQPLKTQNDSVEIGFDIRNGSVKGIRSSAQTSILYYGIQLTQQDQNFNYLFPWTIAQTPYAATVSNRLSNHAGLSTPYGLMSPNRQIFDEWEQPNFGINPQTSLRVKTCEWFYGGYGDNTNFRKPFYVDYSIADWNISSVYGPPRPWFGLEDKELMKTDLLQKFRYLKVISMTVDCHTLSIRMRCIGYAHFGGI